MTVLLGKKRVGDGVVGERAVEIAETDVRAPAAAQDILDLRVRLRPPEAIVERDDGEVRHRQPEPLRESTDDEFGDECAGALPRPAELDDEEIAALAEREGVAGGGQDGEWRRGHAASDVCPRECRLDAAFRRFFHSYEPSCLIFESRPIYSVFTHSHATPMDAPWAGIFPAVTTQFTSSHALDHEAMQQHYRAQIDAGVHGLVVCGSLGESSTLTPEEKLEVLGVALDASDGRVPVLCTVAERATAEACRFAERAAETGADGLMVLPPLLYRSDRRETLAYLRTIAAATDLPLMIYNNPVAYGVDVTPEMFADLADEPTVVAIKESSDDVRRLTDIINLVGDRFQLFCGVDNIALEALLLGADGWLAGLVCAFPEETVAIYDLAKAGRIEEAVAIYRWFMPLLHLDVSPKLVQNIKLASALVGHGTEHVRPPRLPLDGDERARVQTTIETALANRPTLPTHV